MPWLRQLVATVSSWRPSFYLRPVHAGFVIDTVAVGDIFLWTPRVSCVSIIPPVPHTHSFTFKRRYTGLTIDSVIK
jgi:hypothetical protein